MKKMKTYRNIYADYSLFLPIQKVAPDNSSATYMYVNYKLSYVRVIM